MPAGQDTVLQINFKTHGDSLINIYAANPDQLDAALDALQSRLGRIAEVESQFKGAAAVAQTLGVTEIATTVAPPAPAAPEWAATAPAPSWNAPSPAAPAAAPTCAHGPRVARSGMGAKGPWKSWFCSAPKGSNQCDAIWVKQGSPEWNTHPA